ncbi:MAG TPA: zf-HC2 domain-containing protein [Blastocatellia bacterium]
MADNCPELEVLRAYVEGNISPRQRVYMESHLRWCKSCQGMVGVMMRSKTFVPDPPA